MRVAWRPDIIREARQEALITAEMVWVMIEEIEENGVFQSDLTDI